MTAGGSVARHRSLASGVVAHARRVQRPEPQVPAPPCEVAGQIAGINRVNRDTPRRCALSARLEPSASQIRRNLRACLISGKTFLTCMDDGPCCALLINGSHPDRTKMGPVGPVSLPAWELASHGPCDQRFAGQAPSGVFREYPSGTGCHCSIGHGARTVSHIHRRRFQR